MQRGSPEFNKPAEPVNIELVIVNAQKVARRLAHQPGLSSAVMPQEFAKVGNVDLECGARMLRRLMSPNLLDECVGRDHPIAVKQEAGQDRPLLRPTKPKLSAVVRHLERAQRTKLHNPSAAPNPA